MALHPKPKLKHIIPLCENFKSCQIFNSTLSLYEKMRAFFMLKTQNNKICKMTAKPMYFHNIWRGGVSVLSLISNTVTTVTNTVCFLQSWWSSHIYQNVIHPIFYIFKPCSLHMLVYCMKNSFKGEPRGGSSFRIYLLSIKCLGEKQKILNSSHAFMYVPWPVMTA
jgi:hypothetical protein